MPAILIYGTTQKNRESHLINYCSKLGLNNFENVDAIKVEPEEKKKNIGIEQIRIANKFLSEKPINNKYKYLIILRADLLTIQAQNALLKTLEEPPSYAWIFLLSKSETTLIETVVSRCKKVSLKNEPHDTSEDYISVSSVLTSGIGERLSLALKLSDMEKEELYKIMDFWVNELRRAMNLENAKNIEEIVRIKTSLEQTNVTTKLALENLMLRLKG